MTYHNTLFNSKEALAAEMESRDKAHVDNFYDPYISVYTTEDVVAEPTSFSSGSNNNDSGAPIGMGGMRSGSRSANAATFSNPDNDRMSMGGGNSNNGNKKVLQFFKLRKQKQQKLSQNIRFL